MSSSLACKGGALGLAGLLTLATCVWAAKTPRLMPKTVEFLEHASDRCLVAEIDGHAVTKADLRALRAALLPAPSWAESSRLAVDLLRFEASGVRNSKHPTPAERLAALRRHEQAALRGGPSQRSFAESSARVGPCYVARHGRVGG